VKTTIQVDKKVKDKLEAMKVHPKESYNEIIDRLISVSYDDEELSDETMKDIEKSFEQVRQGRTISNEELKERLGIK
jgi:Zn-finger protein